MLADLIHVAGSDREDKVARLRGFAQVALDLFKGLKEFCAPQFSPRGLPRRCREYSFHGRQISPQGTAHPTGAATDKIVEQRHSARIGVRLENNDRALISKRFDSIQKCLKLARMVRVIVVHIRAVEFALKLKSSARSEKPARPYLLP